MTSSGALRYLAALLIVVVGVVHLQQYASFIKDVPTIGTLFLLNAAGAGVIVVLLAFERLRLLGVIGAIALCVGSLVSVAISATSSGLFDYTEATLRTPIVVAVVAEVLALVVLGTFALASRRGASA